MSLLQEMYEDIVESEESDEEDCFISDVTRGGYDVSCGGKHTGHFKEFDDALDAVNAWQKKNKFYPNIWMVSDHGNETLIDSKGKEIREEVEGKNGYVAMYKGKQIDVYADSSYEAQKKAAIQFKAKKSYDVTVILAKKDGKEVVHKPLD